MDRCDVRKAPTIQLHSAFCILLLLLMPILLSDDPWIVGRRRYTLLPELFELWNFDPNDFGTRGHSSFLQLKGIYQRPLEPFRYCAHCMQFYLLIHSVDKPGLVDWDIQGILINSCAFEALISTESFRRTRKTGPAHSEMYPRYWCIRLLLLCLDPVLHG